MREMGMEEFLWHEPATRPLLLLLLSDDWQ
jgi:hypothetical protein